MLAKALLPTAPADALVELDRAEELLHDLGVQGLLAAALTTHAEACWQLGDREGARAAMAGVDATGAAGHPGVARDVERVRALIGG